MNFATPLSLDSYSRLMVDSFKESDFIAVPTGFQSLFAGRENGTFFSNDALVLDIDIMKGNEKTALMINRGAVSRPITGQPNTQTQKYTSVARVFPLIEEEGAVNADQILRRVVGEGIHAGMTREERQRILGFQQHQEQTRRIIRLFERLAVQSVIFGVQDSILGEATPAYDFYRDSANTFTPSTKWNDTTPKILGDIDAAMDLARQNGHLESDIAIISGDVLEVMIADSEFKDLANNRRFQLIDINSNPVPSHLQFMVDGGFTARGRLQTPRGRLLWIFVYNEFYTNDAGSAVNYMPSETAVFLSSKARFDRYFGPPEVLPMTDTRATFFQENFGISQMGMMPAKIKAGAGVIRPEMFHFDAYGGENHKSITHRTQASAIFATTHTDSVVVINNILL